MEAVVIFVRQNQARVLALPPASCVTLERTFLSLSVLIFKVGRSSDLRRF